MSTFHPAVVPPAAATSCAFHFAFVERSLLMPADEAAPLMPVTEVAPAADVEARHYLGQLDGVDVWAERVSAVPPGWRTVSLRAAMMGFAPELMALVGRAAQVLEWDRTHAYCGVCGTAMRQSEHERARACPACGYTAYPRISPAMMALIWREDGRLLLARSPGFTNGVYSALAGFVEPGESIEQCVIREVAEEVGVEVDAESLRYYGSQSWPFPHSLMIAFTARWVRGDIVPQAGEIEHAAWFDIDSLPPIPPRFSISGFLIRDTVAAMRDGGLK